MPDEPQDDLNTGPAEALEEFLMPTLFGPWAAEVVKRAAPEAGERVLDVGCGTGPAARFSADRVGPTGLVFGVDIDAGMLEVGRRCAEREGRKIEWRKGDVAELPFEDQQFDVLLCCQGLQFFPDKPSALTEMRRVLKPDGRLVASVWRDVQFCPGHLAVAKALAGLSGTEPAPMPPFSLGDADEIRYLAESAGFRDVSVSTERKISPFGSANDFVDALAGGAPSTRRALQGLDGNKVETVISQVTEMLREFTDTAGLQLPLESNLLFARA